MNFLERMQDKYPAQASLQTDSTTHWTAERRLERKLKRRASKLTDSVITVRIQTEGMSVVSPQLQEADILENSVTSEFAVLFYQSLREEQQTPECVLLHEWFEENRRHFPFMDENFNSQKTEPGTEQGCDLTVTFSADFVCPLTPPITDIKINMIRENFEENKRKAKPGNAEFVLYFNELPDHTFFNAQFILQLLIATDVFPRRELWSHIFKFMSKEVVDDFFYHFSKLQTFAKYNLQGNYPGELFNKTHPLHAECN